MELLPRSLLVKTALPTMAMSQLLAQLRLVAGMALMPPVDLALTLTMLLTQEVTPALVLVTVKLPPNRTMFAAEMPMAALALTTEV